MTRIQKIQAIDRKINDLQKTKRELLAKTLIKCRHCGKATQIRRVNQYKVFHYEEPYGCTGGDYVYESEQRRWDCKKCNKTNRVWANTEYRVMETHADYQICTNLEHLFAAVGRIDDY